MAGKTITLTVENMSCNHCSAMVQKTLEEIKGLSEIFVDLDGKKARFETDDDTLIEKAITAVSEAGYPASR